MSIKLHGVFSEVFGGILTVRGFASFSDLAKCSQPNDKYQRRPYADHQSQIEQFYRNKHDLFFPELVFAMPIDHIALEAGKYKFVSSDKGVKVNITGTRTVRSLERVNITLPDLPLGQRLLHRIDGNHRLRAYENLGDSEFDRYLVPFCIVLLRKNLALPTEKELFFNINSKAKPLTSEEIYRSIIEDEENFPGDVLKRNFGPEFVLCRALRKRLDFEYLPHLRRVFGQLPDAQDLPDARCSNLIEALRDWQTERQRLNLDVSLPSETALLQAVQRINISYAPRYEGDTRLQRSTASGLFSAFLYFALSDATQSASQQRFAQFENWVLRNHQYELQRISALDLIRIFDKVAQSRSRQIFVSMQFSANTQANFEAIQEAVAELNETHKLDIQLRPIRIDKFDAGYSYEINDEILRLIEESGYLIADLTCGNKNVYHEIGYLMGLNRGKGMKHENFLLLHNGAIGDARADVGFNLTSIKQLRVNDTNTLRKDVKRQIEIYYGLRSA